MKLIDLQLENFRKFTEIKLSFSEGLIGIIGPNGIGKSSIVEAIAWAIFGQDASKTEKQLIPRQNMPKGQICQVILTLDINQKEYRIIRQLSGSNLISKAAIFTKNNGTIEQIAKGTTAVENFLVQLLGMDKNSFFTSFFAKQQELNALSNRQPAQRRKIILNMLGITNVDKAVDALRQDRRALKNKSQLIESTKIDSNFLKAELQSLMRQHKNKKNELDNLINDLNSQKNLVAKEENEINSLSLKRKQYQALIIEEQKLASEITSQKEAYQNLADLKEKLLEQLGGQAQLDKEKINKHANLNLLKLDNEIQKLKKIENELNSQILKVESKKQQIADSANQTKAELSFNKNNLTDISKKKGNVKEAKTKNCPFCGQTLKDDKKQQILNHFQKEIDNLVITIKKKEAFIKRNRQFYAKLQNKENVLKEQLSANRAQLARAKANKNQFATIEEQINSFASQATDKKKHLASLKKEQQKVKEKINLLAFDERTFEEKEKKANEKKEKLHQDELAFKDKEKELSLIANNIKQKQLEIEKGKHIKNQLKALNEEKKILNKLDRLFLEFRKDLIGRIRPSLSKKASLYLGELTDGKYERIELNKDYDIFIFDNGEKFAIERFSGGEKDLVNLCLRLAISELLVEKSNSDFNFLILDEIFGSQDSNRRNNILNALAKLAKCFKQLLVITHIDELKNSMESLISLKEEDSNTIIEWN